MCVCVRVLYLSYKIIPESDIYTEYGLYFVIYNHNG